MKELEKQQIKAYQGAEPVSVLGHIRPVNEYFGIGLWPNAVPVLRVACSEDNTNKIVLTNVNPSKGAIAVKFGDGKVGVVKCNNEKFDIEKGIAIAILKAKDKKKYDFIMNALKTLDDKTAIKAEKALAIYCAKKIVGSKYFDITVSNQKAIQKGGK